MSPFGPIQTSRSWLEMSGHWKSGRHLLVSSFPILTRSRHWGRNGSNSRNEGKAGVDPIRRNRKIAPKSKSQVDKPCGRDMAKKKGGIKFTILPLTPDLWPA